MSITLSDKMLDICASLWISPATVEELARRFKISVESCDRLIFNAEGRGYLYCRGETYYCYKKTVVKVLNTKGYDLTV